MKNLSNYQEFSSGNGKARQSLNFSIPVETKAVPQTEKADPEIPEIDTDTESGKKVKRFQRALQRVTDKDPLTAGEGAFKVCYDVIEAEYLHILKDLNRIEFSDNEMKKHVTELKKAFNDLMVKLQYFSETDKK